MQAQVGGKLAQIGSRLIDGTARKMADEFFNRFAAAVSPESGRRLLARSPVGLTPPAYTRLDPRRGGAGNSPAGPAAPERAGQGRVAMQTTVSLTVNGKPASATVEGRTLLVQLLREHLGLTGTHVGCDTSQCGACVVHVDGEAVKSCTLLAVQAEGRNVLTIEGVANGDTLHPMQEAFRNNHALQCGFCTPGMVMSALDLVKNNPRPSEREVRE